MRGSVTKLRWLLLGGFVLLAVAVGGFFAVARYRAGLVWQRILARNGVHLQHETNGVTYSQSSHGRTVFTLHAGKARPDGKKMMLEDAMLILYGREPGRDDRIYGKHFEYDQEAGILRALGEVDMDLQTPEPGGKPPAADAKPVLTFGPETGTEVAPGIIHVRTSGLVYMRKLGIAATGQPTEFRFGDLTCTSTGAEFDTGQSVVRLLADVRVSGAFHKDDFTLTASHAELNQHDNTAQLQTAVLHSGERSARGTSTRLHLRKDGTLSAAEATGDVELREGTKSLAAPEMDVSFAAANRPEHARLLHGVHFSDTDRIKPAQGSAETVDLLWTGEGTLATATAQQRVSFLQSSPGRDGATVRRQMTAGQGTASFAPVPGKRQSTSLRALDLNGAAQVTAATTLPGGRTGGQTMVAADRLLTAFQPGAGGKPEAQTLQGSGHTRLNQLQADGAHQQSTGDALEIHFAQVAGAAGSAAVEASRAVQTGHVELRSWAAPKEHATTGEIVPSIGHADRTVFSAETHTLTLEEEGETRAHLQNADGELAARQIVLHQDTGDAEASGEIAATSVGRAGGAATHILADRARLLHTAGTSTFNGTTDQPARLWQGASVVQAAELVLDGKAHTLSARPGPGAPAIHAIFATAEGDHRSAGAAAPPASTTTVTPAGHPRTSATPSATDREAVRVVADRMDYNDLRREATFKGQVRMSGATGDAAAEEGTVFLAPQKLTHGESGPASVPSGAAATPSLGGSVDRAVLSGQVRLTEPGRSGTGEQLTYTAASESFVLTGGPNRPSRVTDEGGSTVTGATLLFRKNDNTVVVAGAKGEPRTTGSTRVHTETDLR